MINGDYVTVDHEIHAVLLIRDIRLRNQHVRQIAFMAYHDPLTGLPNRRQFYDKLEETLAEAERSGGEVAILLLDLDRFKQVNDRWGHEAGDQMLCKVAAMIHQLVQPDGLAARFGGDEFVLFCPVGGDGLTAAELEHRLLAAAAQATLDYEGEEPEDRYEHRHQLVSAGRNGSGCSFAPSRQADVCDQAGRGGGKS